jgi:hypothetical protein
VSGRFLRRILITLQLAIVDSFLERYQCRVSIAYASLRELGTQTSFVSGDGEFEDMAYRSSDATFRNKQIVREQEREDGSELSSRQRVPQWRCC